MDTNPHDVPTEQQLPAPNCKGIDIAIYDRSDPQGLMLGYDKGRALQQALFEMMCRDLTSEADISPKFNSSEMVNGVFRLEAVDQHSIDCLVDIIDRMLPPWPNAQLCVDYLKEKVTTIVVEAFVPGQMVAVAEILYKINLFDNRIKSNIWKTMGSRPLGQGHVYTFTIEQTDFELLNSYDGFIPYNGNRIEFRVLKNPDLIPKDM